MFLSLDLYELLLDDSQCKHGLCRMTIIMSVTAFEFYVLKKCIEIIFTKGLYQYSIH